MKELIRKLGEYINNHQTTGIEENIGKCLYETIHWNNSLNAAFEMICWLKENNKI